jgi:hypothetical protein
MSASTYAHVRTEGEFTLDVMAWVTSWSTPVMAMMGGAKKGDGGGPRGEGIHSQIPGKYKWLRPSKASSTRFVDIDALDKPATVGQLAGMMSASFPVANKAAVASFEEKVLARAKKIAATDTQAVQAALADRPPKAERRRPVRRR